MTTKKNRVDVWLAEAKVLKEKEVEAQGPAGHLRPVVEGYVGNGLVARVQAPPDHALRVIGILVTAFAVDEVWLVLDTQPQDAPVGTGALLMVRAGRSGSFILNNLPYQVNEADCSMSWGEPEDLVGTFGSTLRDPISQFFAAPTAAGVLVTAGLVADLDTALPLAAEQGAALLAAHGYDLQLLPHE